MILRLAIMLVIVVVVSLLLGWGLIVLLRHGLDDDSTPW
jgi:hypothetical protein